MYAAYAVVIIAVGSSCFAQQPLPAVVPPVTVEGTGSGVCPAAQEIGQARNSTKSAIRLALRDTVIPNLDRSSCRCGGSEWTRIAHLNMSDPSQQCPPNWLLVTNPQRACGQSTTRGGACDSAIFSANNKTYSRVCGRVDAYQRGDPEGFSNIDPGPGPGLEDVYIDGVSITHGAAGSRQHIWSFVNALHETDPNYRLYWNCACTNTNFNWPYQVPSFIGNKYFCDTGHTGPSYSSSATYPSNPLWDGQGCGPTNACCEFNTPPWFCTTLPQPTTDDIELRICFERPHVAVDITLVDIYVL